MSRHPLLVFVKVSYLYHEKLFISLIFFLCLVINFIILISYNQDLHQETLSDLLLLLYIFLTFFLCQYINISATNPSASPGSSSGTNTNKTSFVLIVYNITKKKTNFKNKIKLTSYCKILLGAGGSKGEPSGNSGYTVKLPYFLLFSLVVAASFATVFTAI